MDYSVEFDQLCGAPFAQGFNRGDAPIRSQQHPKQVGVLGGWNTA